MVPKTRFTGEESTSSLANQHSHLIEEIDLQGIGKALWMGRRIVVVITLIATIGALIATLALPKTYLARATILPTATSDTSHALAVSLAPQLGPAASLLSGMGSRKTADLIEILNSRRLAERVISHYQLDDELPDSESHDGLVRTVMEMVRITPPTLKSKVVSIEVRAPRAELAASICNAYIAELKKILDDIGYNGATKNRQFIETQLTRSREELSSAENELAEFQAKNHLTSLPESISSLIRSIGDLENRLVETRAQLNSTTETLNVAKSMVNTLQVSPSRVSELEIMQKSLSAQEQALLNAKEQFRERLKGLPPQAMILARLQRNVQVQNALYLTLKQQHETALINESRDSDAFMVLDHAKIPEKPAGPKHLQNLLLGLMVGLAAATISAIVVHRPASLRIEAYK